MGLAYSMLALVMLETSEPGQEGFSSSAFQLMFTLGTAFGAGIGGAIVAVADSGALELAAGHRDRVRDHGPRCALTVGVSVACPAARPTGRLAPSG